MGATEFRHHLKRLGACAEGRTWVGRRDLATAWAECERADHMLWLAGMAGVNHQTLVLAAAACAETALEFVPEGEDRPRLAIEAAKAWANDPTEANLQRCREAAYAIAAAAGRTARAQRLSEMAVLVRRIITAEMVAAALNGEAGDVVD